MFDNSTLADPNPHPASADVWQVEHIAQLHGPTKC
jgi:hypothetical protein